MNNATLEKITAELKNELIGQKFGKIFSLKKLQFALIFGCTIQNFFSSALNRPHRAFILLNEN